ncbi:peptidase M14 carboxypeptidase A [Fibrella aestuarina BUZ 2]|uniref:Peptidase M14 carboxypeptidase A n=1 Tax=Fibrella aestuarina BUZ 2 TaxID=1166018 RepID=I0KBP3_9BACT|nr:M14 metallopeptidase family protein [Fibrella aestuarina]CCH01546.1 peptidase M14 carboxypeptidase A [Fibrella aestuarina BUZ 2]
MKKMLGFGLLACLFLASPVRLQAQSALPAPAQFLGYAIGERYTPHHRVLAYAEQIARQQPTRVKVIPYGTTYEGRQLAVVVIANEANMARLDEIRTDNLKRIGMLPGQPSGKALPAIQWLSYNVHGNEAVSSEAFMEVLYGLLEPTKASPSPKAQFTVSPKILETSVVILDPGLNPDGHDRYVNWYNQMHGRVADPTPFAREHSEPWPGGRYTHYLFDPNRDWAWQTQEITQQRMALYQQWMPHLHGDFHEMGVESPYYFAPSAKPYHEDITPFQRQFQGIVGQYCSRYFDRNNWLYYTRERFDLFYPSYGDTYPTYNGAIGMTYEQGGNSRAGLAIRKSDGDTLTLRERIDHHVASSFATLESVADRSAEVVKEFGTFFDNAQRNPVGTFRTYVVKSGGDAGKLTALRQLLDRNQIRYGVAGRNQTLSGSSTAASKKGKTTAKSSGGGVYNYFTQRNEGSLSLAPEDLVISAYQPKSTLLKILFEPTSTLEDSVTYDITAWSLPYAFGLQTYGLTTRLDPVSAPQASTTAAAPATDRPYAYLARWQSMPSVQLLAGLMKNKVRVRAAEKPFELDGQSYGAGTLLITRAGNERLGHRFDELVRQEAATLGVTLTPVKTGFVSKGSDFGSDFVMTLKAPRVGVVSGDGLVQTAVGEVWHYFDQELKYPVSMINGADLGSVDWTQLNVLVLPNGYNYGRILNDRVLTSIREWVRGGGKLIALERAAGALVGKEGFDLKEKDDKPEKAKKALTDSLKTYAERERAAVSDETPGSIYRLNLDATHPLGFGLSGGYYALVNEAHNYDILKDGWNVGYLKDSNLVAGFAGKNAKEKLKQTLAVGVQDLGRGQVIYLADDPLFRGFWYSGKLLFGNAVFF